MATRDSKGHFVKGNPYQWTPAQARAAAPKAKAAQPMRRIPAAYRFLLVDLNDQAWSGWEFRADAADELRDNGIAYPKGTRILSRSAFKARTGR
jgi:hypothetical protein